MADVISSEGMPTAESQPAPWVYRRVAGWEIFSQDSNRFLPAVEMTNETASVISRSPAVAGQREIFSFTQSKRFLTPLGIW